MRYFFIAIGIIMVLLGIVYLQLHVEKKIAVRQEILEDELIQGMSSYRVNQPDQIFNLSSKLQEISGLAYARKLDLLVAIQDENGILYFLNKETGQITEETKFGRDDDYEGIAQVDTLLYILSSHGNLFEYGGKDHVVEFKTDLKKSYDFEGLTYDKNKNQLLLASKESGPRTKSYIRKIFSFDLKQKEIANEPVVILDCREVKAHLPPAKNAPTFSPSAICMDKEDNLYILSSVARALIVLDTSGNIRSGAKLDPGLHLQPEGIVIDDQGILYIANEGRSATPKLFAFKPQT